MIKTKLPIRSAITSGILKRRLPLADRIDFSVSKLRKFIDTCDDLVDLAETLNDSFSNDSTSVDFGSLTAQADELKSYLSLRKVDLEKLSCRFRRENLTIAVVGRARQGKSRLLQSLTGLPAEVIPDGSGSHCTGVKSKISHSNDGFLARVHTHCEDSFLEKVIRPYFKNLKIKNAPSTLDEFVAMDFSSAPRGLSKAANKAMYEHLVAYHGNLNGYRELIESDNRVIELNDESQVREYVAQDDPAAERVFFKYLAVEHVEVRCKFPNDDIGNVSLIDLPGLGDTGIGHQERLLEAIGSDVDLIAFVRVKSL